MKKQTGITADEAAQALSVLAKCTKDKARWNMVEFLREIADGATSSPDAARLGIEVLGDMGE